MNIILKVFKFIIDKISSFINYLKKDIRHLLLFIAAFPVFIFVYLGVVFLGSYTGISDDFIYRQVRDKDKASAPVDQSIIYLNQGWEERYRQQYYFTPQGSPIIPLDIALALEMPDSDALIFAQNGTVVSQFGFLPYPLAEVAVSGNEKTSTHGLPVGFTVDGNSKDSPMLGVNCAACHTSHITHNDKTMRIEGGAALGDFIGLFNAVDDGLAATLQQKAKFDRMAKKIEIESGEKPDSIRKRLEIASARRQEWQVRNSDSIPEDNPQGHGRVDAFGIIFNQALGKDLHQDSPDGNVRTPDAPVSYPVLWDTPYMGRVQWNGSANNKPAGGVLGRNTGQVLGVFGATEITVQGGLPGYCSTVKRRNLQLFDYWIRALESPKWQDAASQGVLPNLDEAKVLKGKNIYNENCAGCHAVIDTVDPNRKRKKKDYSCQVPIKMVPLDVIGTDRSTVETGTRGGAKSGILGGQPLKRDDSQTFSAEETNIALLRDIVAGTIAGSYQTITCRREFGLSALSDSAVGFGKLAKGKHENSRISGAFELNSDSDLELEDECKFNPTDEKPAAYSAKGYKARPLNGIWASAPYLHNGSVPTLYDMLLPPSGEKCDEGESRCRASKFYVGSTKYNPNKVGFVSTPSLGTTLYDTAKPGNHNSGHLYGTKDDLSEADRLDLIEYLKSL
jgi:mono/diheme cytochrome c family protein